MVSLSKRFRAFVLRRTRARKGRKLKLKRRRSTRLVGGYLGQPPGFSPVPVTTSSLSGGNPGSAAFQMQVAGDAHQTMLNQMTGGRHQKRRRQSLRRQSLRYQKRHQQSLRRQQSVRQCGGDIVVPQFAGSPFDGGTSANSLSMGGNALLAQLQANGGGDVKPM